MFPRLEFRLEAVPERAQEPGGDFMPIPALHQLLLANYERSVSTRRRA